jgi:hypothetical protein
MKPKDRHISILEYFNCLQLEFLTYEIRSKVYPSAEDKAKFKKVLELKKIKIFDISKKNSLISIFDNDDLRKEKIDELFGQSNMPELFNRRDKYFYYFIGSEFSFEGTGYKLVSYDLDGNTAIIENNSKNLCVDLIHIRRIF